MHGAAAWRVDVHEHQTNPKITGLSAPNPADCIQKARLPLSQENEAAYPHQAVTGKPGKVRICDGAWTYVQRGSHMDVSASVLLKPLLCAVSIFVKVPRRQFPVEVVTPYRRRKGSA